MYNTRNGYGFNIQENEELMEYIKEHTTNYSNSCTLIWFVDQDTGETKLWTGEVKDPYAIRYQNTEELDQIKIQLLSFLTHKTVFSSKIRNLTKVIIMHEATLEDHLPTFDSKGKPLNHDQYVIVNGTCSLRQGNGHYFEHEYSLAEPLYYLRYWATETQSVTNMTSITISELNDSDEWEQKTYTQDETNLYYVLKRMLQITGYRTSVEDCTLDTLVSVQDKELLTNACRGINDNFMASNAYNFIIKLSKYIDRLPVLYFNPNYEVQDSNNLDESKKEYLLFFERKETGNLYTEDEVFKDISGYCECELAMKDAGTIVVDAQNLVSSTPVWYPGYGYFCGATGERGKLKLTEDSYVSIKLPSAIEKVLTVKVCETTFETSGSSSTTAINEIVDVPCIEEQEWLNISSSSERKKYFYYKKYSNVIEVNHSDYKVVDELSEEKSFSYSIEYIPAFDARIKMPHKNKLETSITQTDATLDSKAYGAFLKNYAKENCNTDYSLARTYYSFNEILMPGDLIEMNKGGRLVVASTDISRKNNSYFVTYVFNEYIVKRSSLISASNLIDNKIIDKTSTMKRFINLSEKQIKVGLSFNLLNENSNCELNYIKDTNIIFNGYVGTYPELDYYPNIAFTKLEYDDGTSKYFSFNVNKCQAGKSIILNINTEDSTLLFFGSLRSRSFNYASYNYYYKYTDSFGKINNISLIFSDFEAGIHNAFQAFYYGSGGDISIFESISKIVDFIQKYPSLTEEEYLEKETTAPIKVEDLLLLKDTSETLNISMQINFTAENSDTILFDKFVELNPILSKNGINETINDDNVTKVKHYDILILDKGNHIDESMINLSGIVSLNDFKINSLSCSMTNINTYKFDFSNNPQYVYNNQQVVLCQIVVETDSSTNNTSTSIYPLVAKTFRTSSEKLLMSKIYLEFLTDED